MELGSDGDEQSIEYKVWGHYIASIRDLFTHSTTQWVNVLILVFHNVFIGITHSEMSSETVNFHQIIHDLKQINFIKVNTG